jgi:type III secretory pathway component EscS
MVMVVVGVVNTVMELMAQWYSHEIVKYGSKVEILDFSNNNFEFMD